MGHGSTGRGRQRVGSMSVLLAAFLLLLAASEARANFVYWTSGAPNSSIARAKLNGSGLDKSFIAGVGDPHAVATDAKYVYWTQGDATNGSIGRANLNGSGANQLFIPHQAGVGNPSGIAVTQTAIYWQHDGNEIGRANIDGTGVDPSFIPATNSSCGLAADSNFLYFLNRGGTRIGRATLDGSSVMPDFASIPEAFCGLAVDYNYVYWGSDAGNTIGAVPVGGGTPVPDYVDAGTTGGGPSGVAVNSQFLFWGNIDTGAIARANVNGSAPKLGLIPDAGVTGPPDASQVTAAPANKITVDFVVQNRKKGTATIQARVPSPGVVTMDETNTAPDAGASAAAVQQVTYELPRAEVFQLTVAPAGKTAKKLAKRVLKKGKAHATALVYLHFTPATVAGVPNSVPVTVTLVKKGPRRKHRRR
jgi:hypothetical protein